MKTGKFFLIIGGTGSLFIALLHAAIPVAGPQAYQFFGGDWLLPPLREGSPFPALLTLSLAALFAVWGLYAFSGAGIIPRLPLLRTGLILICGLYIVRGLNLVAEIGFRLAGEAIEWKYSIFSAVSLGIGMAHFLGLWARRRKWV